MSAVLPSLTFSVDTHVDAWTLAGDVVLFTIRYDNTTATPTVLPGYELINLSASTALSKDLKALLPIDNLGDKVYQTASTFAMSSCTLNGALIRAPQ